MQRHLSKLWGIIFLGLWIMFVPALGIRREYINIIVIISGLAVTVLSFLLARAIAQNLPALPPRDDRKTS